MTRGTSLRSRVKGNFQARFWNSGGRGDSPTDCSAYLSWELRVSPKDQTPDDIRARALRNFDYVAEVADVRKAWGEDMPTFAVTLDETTSHPVGKVRQFFRDAVDYHPPEPPSPINN